mgnify:CR=1 FL=1
MSSIENNINEQINEIDTLLPIINVNKNNDSLKEISDDLEKMKSRLSTIHQKIDEIDINTIGNEYIKIVDNLIRNESRVNNYFSYLDDLITMKYKVFTYYIKKYKADMVKHYQLINEQLDDDKKIVAQNKDILNDTIQKSIQFVEQLEKYNNEINEKLLNLRNKFDAEQNNNNDVIANKLDNCMNRIQQLENNMSIKHNIRQTMVNKNKTNSVKKRQSNNAVKKRK